MQINNTQKLITLNNYISFKQDSKSKVKVSVILPIYNQEKYLDKALNSLEKQSLKDAEFICINDGSTDNSLNILQTHAKKDSRIKIINQKNQGTGRSRNNGLKVAIGEYIAFLDPDDWLEKDALESLYNKSKNQNCDMVIFNFRRLDDKGKYLSQFDLKKRFQKYYNIREEENFTWRNIKPRVLGGTYPVAWNKFYKTDFVKQNKLHFAKSNLAEDHVFVFGATLNAKNIGYLDKCLYNYVVHDNSATKERSDKYLCIFRSIDSVINMIKKLGLSEELKKEINGYVIRFLSYHSKQILSKSKFIDICKRKLPAEQNQILSERFSANPKLLPIINSLLASKKLKP